MLRCFLAFLILARAFGQDASINSRVDGLFRRWDNRASPGCALAVVRDGAIVYKRGYGMADLDHDIPITPSSVFHAASLSKQFTAAAIVLLAQEGKLSLDDEVRRYIPELPDFGVPITIRHLIHHTSGLRDQWNLLELAGWRYSLDLISDDDVLQMMARQKDLNFPPGQKFMYCNTGYTLLAQIVKRVSGRSFRELTAARIFQPLGMKNTHFRDDHAEIVKGQAYGYVPAGETFRLSMPNFDTVGATSLLTTVEDLARWDENFDEPRVGGRKLILQMLEPGKLNSGETLDYAFGLKIGNYRGLPIVDHAGADAGYRAHLIRFPEQHFSVACLCNLSTADPGGLARKVADLYLSARMKRPARPSVPPRRIYVSEVDPTPAKLREYAGMYRSDEMEAVYTFVVEDGQLLLERLKRKPERLRPLTPDAFRGRDGVFRFVRDSGGEVSGAVLDSERVKNFRFRKDPASDASERFSRPAPARAPAPVRRSPR